MSLRRSLLLSVFVGVFALTGCETLGLKRTSDAPVAPPAPVAAAPAVSAPTPATAELPKVVTDAPTSQTLVGRQISQLRGDLNNLLTDMSNLNAQQTDLRNRNQNLAATYYSIVGEVNAKLQTGTTPGNPRLLQRWQDASSALDQFAATGNELNGLSSRIGASASLANYLLDATRATYSLSGAVDEDHTSLKALEDDVQRSVIGIQRAHTELANDVARQNAYVAGERRNLQTLSLAIARGEVYGQNLSNTAAMGQAAIAASAPTTPVTMDAPAAPRAGVLGQLPAKAEAAPAAKSPFVIVRFDRPDVDYGQPLYQAMSQALEKNPMGNFEVVAVSPRGDGASQGLAASQSRTKAEDVMRTMAEMGVPADRMQLTTATSPEAKTAEVHMYLR